MFDDLHFVGDRTTSAWVLATPEGYILLDAGFHGIVEVRSSAACASSASTRRESATSSSRTATTIISAARHAEGYWGGDGAGHLDRPGLRQYVASAQRFAGLEPRADVPLRNHVVADGTVEKPAPLKARGAGDPNPFVTGNAEFRAWAGQLQACAEAFLPTARP